MVFDSAKIKRIIFALVLFLTLFGCDESARPEYISDSAQTLMSRIAKGTVLEATREYVPENPNSKDILKNYYHISDPDLLDDFCVLLPSGKNISEIAIFLFSDDEGKQIAENAVKTRRENIISICKAMYPAKVQTAENGEILRYSNAIIMVITPNNNEAVKNIIDNTT